MKSYRKETNNAPAINRRRGSVMVAAAICLLLATLLLASALKLANTGRKQVRRDQLQLQANWLAEAGLERAASRLESEAGYQGETWKIVADELDGQHTGEVLIKVSPEKDVEDSWVVIVEARYPAGATLSATKTRRSTVSIETE
jgi:Tfp pilus assembly protein PilX